MARTLRFAAVAEALDVSVDYLYDHLDRCRQVIDFGGGHQIRVLKLACWMVPAVELARFLGEDAA